MSLLNERLAFAADLFLRRLAAEFRKTYPEQECPIRSLNDYPIANRASLFRSLDVAIKSQAKAADEHFASWQSSRQRQVGEGADTSE